MNATRIEGRLASGDLDILDKQHRRILHLVAQIGGIVEKEGVGMEALQINGDSCHALTNDLFETVTLHFRCEEDLLGAFEYPLLGEHRKEHSEFIERLTKFLFTGILKGVDLAGLYAYANDWMCRHKQGPDTDYANFLRGK